MKFFAFILALLALAGCSEKCTNTVKAELKSPDGKYVATAFIRDCDATAGPSPQVSLRPVGKPMTEVGNIFIGNHSENIKLEWLSPSLLVIYSDCNVVRHDVIYEGIKIEKRGWQ